MVKQSAAAKLYDTVLSLDLFGNPISLNFKGKDSFRSCPGVLLTLFVYSVLLHSCSSALSDLISFGEMDKGMLVVYDVTDTETYNFFEHKQEITIGIYERSSNKYVPLDPRLGTM